MGELWLILVGVAVGIVVAAPVGPVNVICIRTTLRHGALNGVLAGLGAALGDGVFALIAAFGITTVIQFIEHYAVILQIVGGLFLVGLGVRTYRTHPHLDEVSVTESSSAFARVLGTTFALTITNPATMLGFIAIFGGIAGFAAEKSSYGHAAILVGAVAGGSLLWWLGLAQFVSLFRNRMNDHMLELVNQVSGVIIVLFGLAVLARVGWGIATSGYGASVALGLG